MDRLSTKGQTIDQIDLRGVPHSGFDRSNHNYFTGKLGTIIATRLDEVYPGDRIKGRPQLVANFEPLVAPIMGSMVLKQEAFFVPYIQLWKHAWKFFTGKNGFSEPMPSISPRGIYDCYHRFIYQVIFSGFNSLSQIYNTLGTEGMPVVDYEDVWRDYQGLIIDEINHLLELIDYSYKMADLYKPAFDPLVDLPKNERFKYFASRLENATANYSSRSAMAEDLRGLAIVIGDAFDEVFNYFHGVSSLFDYLGWPLPHTSNLDHHVEINTSMGKISSNNIFAYGMYRNTFIPNSYDFDGEAGRLFSEIPLNFMPFKAYYLIWYWNYRDQLLETDILDPEEDEFLGTELTDDVILYCTINRQRCWFKDAYTTALTNTGDGNLMVPLVTTDANIGITYFNGDNLLNTTDEAAAINQGATVIQYTVGSLNYKVPMNYLGLSTAASGVDTTTHYGQGRAVSIDLFDRIKRLRNVVQKRLILGYEVDDVVWSSFLVRMSSVRQHVPELLGQGRDEVQINTVVNNTSTSEQIAGDKTATAWCQGSISEMNYFSEDWGLYLQFATIMPIQSYAGGTQRLYHKLDSFDFMWPEFATMGMDAIYNFELAAAGEKLTDVQAMQVFGYQGRYYDLKYRQDEEHGRIRTDLNYLTFSREFDRDNPPKLNYWFVHCWPRLDGFVIESPLVDVFRADCYTAQGWERRLPVPSTIVH